MKKNTIDQVDNKENKNENKNDTVFYTIIDRYLEFCNQAQLNSGRIKWNDKYLNCWFPY